MNMKHNLAEISANIVYVKPIDRADLSQELRDQAGDLDHLYAVHNADGEQLALVAHPDIAVRLAHDNDMKAVSLH